MKTEAEIKAALEELEEVRLTLDDTDGDVKIPQVSAKIAILRWVLE